MNSTITTLCAAAALTCALLVPAKAEARSFEQKKMFVMHHKTYPIVPAGKIKPSHGFKSSTKPVASVPELGGQGAASAFALLGGGLLLLSQRRRKEAA